MKKELTKIQSEYFKYLDRCISQTGLTPSNSKLAKHFGVSHGTVWGHLTCLEGRGYIKVNRKIYPNVIKIK